MSRSLVDEIRERYSYDEQQDSDVVALCDEYVTLEARNAELERKLKEAEIVIEEIAQEAHTMGKIYERALSPVNPALEYANVSRMASKRWNKALKEEPHLIQECKMCGHYIMSNEKLGCPHDRKEGL